MLGQGHTLRLLDEAREVGRHRHPGPENQDSQRMIDQPRGSFPEKSILRNNPTHVPNNRNRKKTEVTYDNPNEGMRCEKPSQSNK